MKLSEEFFDFENIHSPGKINLPASQGQLGPASGRNMAWVSHRGGSFTRALNTKGQ
jgi:hypothetical protein